MAAYVIAQVEVLDRQKFSEYLREVPRSIAAYGGKYIARGGETVLLEGDDQGTRLVLIEFPSLQNAKAWYNSEEYRKIKSLRDGAARGSLVAIDGC